MKTGHFIFRNRTWSPGQYREVLTGRSDVTLGALLHLFNPFFSLGSYVMQHEARYISRYPRPIPSFYNILVPLSPGVWWNFVHKCTCYTRHLFFFRSATLLSLLGFSLFFLLAHKVYQLEPLSHLNLAKNEPFVTNFFISTTAKITEPDPLPWFSKWSTGYAPCYTILCYTTNLLSTGKWLFSCGNFFHCFWSCSMCQTWGPTF